MNPHRNLSMVRDRNAIYANISKHPQYKDALGNVFFTKGLMDGTPLSQRGTYIPPKNDALYANSPIGMYTSGVTPLGFMRPRFIGALISGLFGAFRPPATHNTSVTFNTSVSETIAFKNSVKSFNQALSDFVLSQSQVVISSASQLSNFNIVNLYTTDSLSLSITSNQSLKFVNLSQVDVKATNKFVLEASTNLFTDILNRFEATNIGTLNILNSTNKNSNLINSLLEIGRAHV